MAGTYRGFEGVQAAPSRQDRTLRRLLGVFSRARRTRNDSSASVASRGTVSTSAKAGEARGFANDRLNGFTALREPGLASLNMRAALPNARFFGLTGTPISDKDRNTFQLFGDPNDSGYVLNTYSMERSIADGASVPVHVESRMIDFHLDQAALTEAEKALAEEENLTDEERDYLASRAGHDKTVLLNPERITAVCTDVLDHFEVKVAPLGMKAQIVAFDRELVVAYDQELRRLIAERGLPFEVAVVMTVGSKEDPPTWLEYALDRAQEAHVKARFTNPDDPLCFLLVTAKLLTGFDAPVEMVQYLDRPLRRHTSFQAITRTNRRYTNTKTGQEKHYGLMWTTSGWVTRWRGR